MKLIKKHIVLVVIYFIFVLIHAYFDIFRNGYSDQNLLLAAIRLITAFPISIPLELFGSYVIQPIAKKVGVDGFAWLFVYLDFIAAFFQWVIVIHYYKKLRQKITMKLKK